MRTLTHFLLAGAAILAVPAAADAAVTLNTGVGAPVVLTASGPGYSIDFDGQANNVVIPGLSSYLTLSVLSQTSTSTVFNFTLANDSGSPITSSRVSAFGFDVTPDVTGASSPSVVFDNVDGGNISNGRSVELCFTAGPNCNGASGGGVDQGTSTTSTFTLNFAGGNGSNITLSNFIDRYQSINSANLRDGSAIGVPVPPAVPEPATWAMMLVGFGAAGVSLRRRKPAALQAA